MTDRELLSKYAAGGDQGAFAGLASRHGNWVYSCARRLVRRGDLAEDVAQGVFILLAQKARQIKGEAHLAGWLFRATQYCAREAMRSEARRHKHEREAAMRQAMAAGGEGADWEEIWPVLDEAVGKLGSADREAVLLRFYQGLSVSEVAAAIGTGEEAAKKRVQRAVEKLRGVLAKKGVMAGVGALGVVMAEKVTAAAPAGLVEAATAAAGGGGAGSAGMIAKGAIRMMAWAKVKVAAGIFLVVVPAGSGARHVWAQKPAALPATTQAAADDVEAALRAVWSKWDAPALREVSKRIADVARSRRAELTPARIAEIAAGLRASTGGMISPNDHPVVTRLNIERDVYVVDAYLERLDRPRSDAPLFQRQADELVARWRDELIRQMPGTDSAVIRAAAAAAVSDTNALSRNPLLEVGKKEPDQTAIRRAEEAWKEQSQRLRDGVIQGNDPEYRARVAFVCSLNPLLTATCLPMPPKPATLVRAEQDYHDHLFEIGDWYSTRAREEMAKQQRNPGSMPK